MKRRRIEVGGEIELQGEGRERYLSIRVDNASVEKWLSALWAIEFGFGEVVVVPEAGLKCRILAIDPEAGNEGRVDTVAEGIVMTPSRYLFEWMAYFLANYYYRRVSANHVDLNLTIDCVPRCGLVFGLMDSYLAPELRPDPARAELFRARRP